MSWSINTATWMDHKNNVLEVGSRMRPMAQDHRVNYKYLNTKQHLLYKNTRQQKDKLQMWVKGIRVGSGGQKESTAQKSGL